MAGCDESQTLDVRAAPELLGAAPRLVLLALLEGAAQALVLPERGELILGREPTCGLRIDHPSVSRQHARLLVGEQLSLVDLGSRNGTHVHGAPLRPGVGAALVPGAVFTLGRVPVVVQRVAAGAPTVPLAALSGARAEPGGDHELVSTSALRALLEVVDRIADTDLSVLITGETGVGKDVVAEALHRRSARRRAPLVRLHCAALSPSLVETELFGHEKGAFTGATSAKPGLIETAHGGTVFIDEVGELPPEVQVKLLRVLEDRRVMRVGAVRAHVADVRFVFATNRELEAEVQRGAFRRDLYYRLAGMTLAVPPLREQRGDLPRLARAFLERAAARLGRSTPTLHEDVLPHLVAHDWPGNVRELKNVMERAVALCPGEEIGVQQLALSGAVAARGTEVAVARAAPGAAAPEVEREAQAIAEAIARCGGNQTEAAALLGISRRTLLHRLDRYELPRPRKRC